MLIREDLEQIQKVIRSEVEPIRKDIKSLKSDGSEVRNDVKVLIAYFSSIGMLGIKR